MPFMNRCCGMRQAKTRIKISKKLKESITSLLYKQYSFYEINDLPLIYYSFFPHELFYRRAGKRGRQLYQ